MADTDVFPLRISRAGKAEEIIASIPHHHWGDAKYWRLVSSKNETTVGNAHGKLLGKGTYGTVYLVQYDGVVADRGFPLATSSDLLFAVKSIAKSTAVNAQMQSQIEKEIRSYLDNRHPNLLRCFACTEDSAFVHIFLEYCPNGDLFQLVNTRALRRFSELEAFYFFMQIVNGVHALHSKGRFHRDLKLENLLLATDYSLRIGDHGWVGSVIGSQANFKFCGTLDYLSPEMVLGSGHDWRVDVWSLGVLLFEMLTGKPPFVSQTAGELATNILAADVDPLCAERGIAADAAAVISGLLHKQIDDRLRLADLSQEPWCRRMWAAYVKAVVSGLLHASSRAAPLQSSAKLATGPYLKGLPAAPENEGSEPTLKKCVSKQPRLRPPADGLPLELSTSSTGTGGNLRGDARFPVRNFAFESPLSAAGATQKAAGWPGA